MDALAHLDPQVLGGGGVVVAVVVLFVLWRLFKLALKVALFIAVSAGLAAFVATWLKHSAVALPVPRLTSPSEHASEHAR